jgi:uncharacterized protein (TIGR00730 family)
MKKQKMNLTKFKRIFIDIPSIILTSIYEDYQYVRGSLILSKVSYPRITFFGGAHLPEQNPYFYKASLLAKTLAENNIAIVTGGGPGVMESANKAATQVGKQKNKIMSVGITVKGIPGEKLINVYAQKNLILNNYFMRKWILIDNSVGFVVFPGGYGTVDELATVLTLIQIKKIKKVPVILIGKDFWEPINKWIHESALKYGTINDEHVKLLVITDDIEDACRLLIGHCKQYQKCDSNQPT